MSTTVEKIASNKVKLSFEVDSEKFDAAMAKAYLKVRNQVTIPGFRKGKAPRKMIENMYGEGVFYDEAFELIFDEVYGPAVEENNVEVVDRPEIEIQEIGAGKALKFTCEAGGCAACFPRRGFWNCATRCARQGWSPSACASSSPARQARQSWCSPRGSRADGPACIYCRYSSRMTRRAISRRRCAGSTAKRIKAGSAAGFPGGTKAPAQRRAGKRAAP